MAGQEGLEPPAAGFGVRSSTIRATGLYPKMQNVKSKSKREDGSARLHFLFLPF